MLLTLIHPELLLIGSIATANIGSAIGSLFTAPGTNAAESQQNQQHQAGAISSNLLTSYAPYVQNQIGFLQSQQPQAQSAVQGLGQFTTQAGRNSLANAFQQNAMGQAQTAAAQTGGQFAGNPALAQAYKLNAYDGANQATNQYAQQINSPQGEAQAYQTYLAGLQSQSPDFNGIGSLTGNINNQPKVQVGQGLGGYLTSLAAPLATAYSAGLFGGGDDDED